ncbi:cytochrome p450 oxidoreductase [Pochonia chlamydosporia 170]|uniref:Cytochrome p450 oxidoreductase n=1 Tax=Pochonia chlamydosporia 170 TaxID=1380566 RepID=A0A179FQS2_METCM|nr:cytochrome p450 oxidoreductase [Pochonia chlamydosporia 170]OAQ67966.1 cytochrome p450 oxidoreductase [Pochonia chlamydosporia 170]
MSPNIQSLVRYFSLFPLNMEALLILSALLSLVFYLVLHKYTRTYSRLPLPPGPKGLPIIGNIFSLPPNGVPEYEHWLKFKDLYGPISSITVLGRTLVILHDRKAVDELLEKMSTKTSSRPENTFSNMSGFNRFVVNMQYGAQWRQHRKVLHQYLGTEKLARRFDDVQDMESRRLLLRLLTSPENLVQHFKTEAGAIILRATYGYAIEPHSPDPLVQAIEEMMNNLSKSTVPLSWAVDVIPALRFLPNFLPGTSFKQTAKEAYAINDLVTDVPYQFVQQEMAKGAHRPSFVSSSLTENKHSNGKEGTDHDAESVIKVVAAIMYGGGADTTVAVLTGFVLAMILFPKVQQQAQEELDRVLGDKLPDAEDQNNLPYVSAVVKEAMRWFPIAPVNTPHATDAEIQYGGYRIPKGSYILASTWWLLHDPQVYQDPNAFDPDRFLLRNEPEPTNAMFGFGRRICPGRFVAEKSLFITIARLLSTFTVRKGAGEAKRVFTPGLIAHPAEFSYEITPRSEKHAAYVRAIERDVPWEKGDSGLLSR